MSWRGDDTVDSGDEPPCDKGKSACVMSKTSERVGEGERLENKY